MSSSDIQEKIAAARREAETLKEKIRAKREQLADTSRKYTRPRNHSLPLCHSALTCRNYPALTLGGPTLSCLLFSEGHGSRDRPATEGDDETEKDAERTFGQNLRDALVSRQTASRFGVTRWQVDRLGRLHHEQSSRDSIAVIMGHDLRVLPLGQFRRLWRS